MVLKERELKMDQTGGQSFKEMGYGYPLTPPLLSTLRWRSILLLEVFL